MRVEISHRITPNEYISYFAYSVRSNIAGSIPRTVPTVPVAIHRIRFLPIRKESKSHKLDKRLNKPLKQSFNSNTMKRFFSRDFWMQKSTVQSWCYVSTGGNLPQSKASPSAFFGKVHTTKIILRFLPGSDTIVAFFLPCCALAFGYIS
eukprot:TRINITY_DN944_c0_g1_i12.p1 TRINITY_DN944_c0_g1~~TRINITY_DN944_c0_g1_i12.p1  ORF type:complete len:149 (-),score=2.83 TRINITY_DN944_c0_g1_i12:117-563(-)